MERLTITYEDGTHGVARNLPCGENSHDFKKLLVEKVGEYEDTNLTPSQLKDIDKLYLEKCEEVNKLKEFHTPKKPTWVLHQGKGNNYQKCPNCDRKWLYLNQDYCEWCGQAIDWSVEE